MRWITPPPLPREHGAWTMLAIPACLGLAVGGARSLAAWLTLTGLRDSVVYFAAPSELATKAKPGHIVRLGGIPTLRDPSASQRDC